MKVSPFCLVLILFFSFNRQSSHGQVILKNTCTNSTEPVLFTDAVNYFRIENWPGKSLMQLECSNCTIEFQDGRGVFKLTPSDNLLDTLKVFKDEKLLQQFILSHQAVKNVEIHLNGGKNKTISRKSFTTGSELVIKAGKPGCRTIYIVQEYDIVFAGEKIHCTGDHLTEQAVAKLLSLQSGMQFDIENATYLQGKETISLPSATYFLKD